MNNPKHGNARLLASLKSARERIEQLEAHKAVPIAVVGMACRFPGADDPDAFAELLFEGREAIVPVPRERWDAAAFYDSDMEKPGKMISNHGGFLRDVDLFDPHFFEISSREAVRMDPQQRLLLEVSWQALERAGMPPDRKKPDSTGVFIGISQNDYAQIQQEDDAYLDVGVHTITGNALNAAAGRLAFCHGFNGPCMAIDTACSSSLVALLDACRSLQRGECQRALAGAVGLILSPVGSIALSKANVLSPDSRCKTFDQNADGIVRGEGCAVVVLKRLDDAQRDGDHIHAVIKGGAMNQDGPGSGLTVPNGPAQEALIKQALNDAGLRPDQLDYVEAHGTGTSLGDPIEIHALGKVFGKRSKPLVVSSVKTNVGHLEAVSGLAGLFKVVAALEGERIPAHLHLREPSKAIRWQDLDMVIPNSNHPWPRGEQPRRAGVSAFGLTGTNTFVILEEAPVAKERIATDWNRAYPMILSARTTDALAQKAEALLEMLEARPSFLLRDISYSLSRSLSFEHRAVILARDVEELKHALDELTTGRGDLISKPEGTRKAALIIGGDPPPQELVDPLRRWPVFQKAFEAYEQQDVVFAFYHALARLWLSWGVEPARMVGVGCGELVVGHLCGYFGIETALALLDGQHPAASAFKRPKLSAISAHTGQVVSGHDYWLAGQFSSQHYEGALESLAEAGIDLVIPLGVEETSKLKVFPHWCSNDAWESAERPELVIKRAWLAGLNCDWSSFGEGLGGALCHLPTYPFQRKRFWLESARVKPPLKNRWGKNREGHPLLGTKLELADSETLRFENVLDLKKAFYLRDHQPFNHIVFPAAAYLEIAHAGARFLLRSDNVGIEQFVLHQPMILSDELKKTQALFEPDGFEAWTFRFFSHDEGDWKLHAICRISSGKTPTVIEPRDTDRSHVSVDTHYEKLAHTGITFGPHFQAIKDLRVGEDGVKARIKLQPDLSTDDYLLHPVMIDACFQMLAAAFPEQEDEGDVYLPVQIDGMAFFDKSVSEGMGWLRVREADSEQIQVDLGLDDMAGNRVFVIKGLTVKSVDRARFLKMFGSEKDLFYYTNWLNLEEFTKESALESCLVLGAPLQLCQGLEAQGISVRNMGLNWTSDIFEDKLELALADSPDDILLVAPEDPDPQSLARMCRVVTLLAGRKTNTRVWILTRGAHASGLGADDIQPAQAQVWGLGLVMALEYSTLQLRLVDLDPLQDWATLHTVLSNPDRETQVIIREGQRLVPRLSPYETNSNGNDSPSLEETGSYLITGGLSGLGLEAARYLAENGAHHLALLGRSEPSMEAQEVLTALADAGVRVEILRCDVADGDELERVLHGLSEKSMPPICGVIHAAGVLDDASISQLTAQHFERVCLPKVVGVENLYRATLGLDLDFFVCFSSLAALWGSPGQGNYAAANAYLDCFAARCRAEGLNFISINWGPWSQVGMAARMTQAEQERIASLGLESLTPDRGLRAMGRLFHQERPSVAVIPVHWPTFVAKTGNGEIPSLFDQLIRPSTGNETFGKVSASPRIDSANLEDTVLAWISKILEEPVQHLHMEKELSSLGFDSLMVLELRNQLESKLHISLPMDLILDDLSPSQLVSWLKENTNSNESQNEDTHKVEEIHQQPELEPATDPLSNMSPEDVAFWLQAISETPVTGGK